MSDTLPPEVKRQVDMIENIIKSRVAVGSQVARSKVVNSLRESVGVVWMVQRRGTRPFQLTVRCPLLLGDGILRRRCREDC